MTNEEVQRDCGKFIDYLQDNGRQVLAFAVMTDNAKIHWGNAEMLNELSVSLLADQLGYKVVPK